MSSDKELMQRALEALTAYDGTNGASQRKRVLAALRERLAQPEQEPMALETVYETIIHWDEGGGKRSRRELARRIVDLYSPPQRKPLTPQSPCEMTQAEGKMFKLGWLECEAAHGIKGEA